MQRKQNRRKNNGKPKPLPKPRRRQPRLRSKRPTHVLHAHEHLYARALADPFGVIGSVGVPDGYGADTHKFHVRTGGTCAVGTGGVAFVAMATHNPVSDDTSLYTSAAAYALTTIETDNVNTTAVSIAGFPNLVAEVSGNRNFRIVAAGIRIRYIGTDDNLAGYILPWRETASTGANLLETARSADTIRGWTRFATVPVSRQWTTIAWHPIGPNSLDFTATLSDSPNLLLAAFGAVAGEAFEWEMTSFCEWQGSSVGRHLKSAAAPHSSKTGAIVRVAAAQVQTEGSTLFHHVINAITAAPNMLLDMASHLVRAGGRGLASMSPTQRDIARQYATRAIFDAGDTLPVLAETIGPLLLML